MSDEPESKTHKGVTWLKLGQRNGCMGEDGVYRTAQTVDGGVRVTEHYEDGDVETFTPSTKEEAPDE